MTEEKQKELRKKICIRNLIHVLILVLIFLGTAFLLNRKPWEGYAIPRYRGTSRYAEPGWVFRKGDTVLETGLKPPAFRHMETGENYSLSAVLTYDGSGDQVPYCFYFVDHMYTRVLLDGEELFHYLPEDIVKREHSRSPGNVYAGVQLPHDCRGKELTIEFIPALSEKIEFQLPNPVFSDYATEAARTFRQELPQNLVALAAAFLGIASILFSTMMLSGSRYREGLFIGIFATLYCLYNLTESNFAFYVISNPYYTYVLDYTTFTLIPIFLMAFLRERLDARQKFI